MRCARRLSKLRFSSVSGGTADGGKNMRAARPHTPRQVRVTCTPANKFAVFIKTVWCRCVASAAIQLRKLVVRSTKSPAGAVQSAQWRELDLSSSRATAESPRSCAVPVGSRSSASRLLAVEPPTGKKHEGCAPSYSAAGESHLHPGKQVCRLYKNSMVQVVSDSERKIPEKIPRSVATVYFNCILYRFGTNAIQAVFQDFFTEWHIFRE